MLRTGNEEDVRGLVRRAVLCMCSKVLVDDVLSVLLLCIP